MSDDALQRDKRRVELLELAIAILLGLLILLQFVWGVRFFWTLIWIWAVLWILVIWAYRLKERVRGKRFRTGLRILVFVVWFALVFGIAQLPWWPESWGVAYAVVSVSVLLLASLGVGLLERRDVRQR
jgi:hypothetical protein